MFIKGNNGLKNYTKVFCRITGRNNIRVKINSIYRRIYILLGLNSQYSVLFGLTFDVIHENTSHIQDLIAERANEVSSGENDK